MCELCENDLRDGFCSLCNSRNSCVYDPNPNSFDCSPDSYHPPHTTYETYSGDSCGNDSHFGYDCPPRVLLLAWDRVLKIKDALGNKQYKSEDIQELFRKLFNDVQNINEELAEYTNTPSWNRPALCNNGDDDDEDCTIASGVENLVPIPRESEDFFEDECECDVPDCDDSQTTKFSTFSNPLFDDSTSSDDDEFNPIHNEDLDSTPKNDRFDTKSYLLESLLNRDESIPPGIDNDDSDSEGDNLFLERLLHDDPIPLLDALDFSYDV
nr:hypothetical protein [Tanacetum cinerariifolium]